MSASSDHHPFTTIAAEAVTHLRAVGLTLSLLLLAAASGWSATPEEYIVAVEAAVTENPPSISLSWPLEPRATGYVIRRKLASDATWGPDVFAGGPTGWTDTAVQPGIAYEYQVGRPTTIPKNATETLVSWGYISAGIRVEAPDHRGTVVLLVDDTMAAPLAAELQRLADDLVGDGWSVRRHDVARTASVVAVKALIMADYAAAPTEVRSVLLFGHVPVPYAGSTAYDGHVPEHQGAWAADVYYGDMDGTWTDTTVNIGTGHFFAENDNVPGDGKFDQTNVPQGTVELEVGRVDLANMPAFAPKSETDLLRQYLDKDHAHRHGAVVLPRRALIFDAWGEFGGEAFAQGAWRWASLIGRNNVHAGTFDMLATQGHLLCYLGGSGWVNSVDNIHTADFAATDPQAAFTLFFGSWFGDWDKTDDLLRAPLAGATSGLTCAWCGRPQWFLHRMALGATIGDSVRISQANSTVYLPRSFGATGIHMALMGDPTLRLLAVRPPTAVMATQGTGGNPLLTWAASPDATIGYHILRGPSAAGPFTRVTAEPVTQTSWTDTAVASGTVSYQLKAVKLETTAGGTFVNTSQAVTATITLGGQDLGFEHPETATYVYGPTGSAWTFAGAAGLTANASGFTAGNPSAPQGRQAAFLQMDGAFAQRIGGFTPGHAYILRFEAAQRGNWQASSQDFRVEVDGRDVGVFRPYGVAWQPLATAPFIATGDSVLVRFVGIDSRGGDNTAFIDDLRVDAASDAVDPDLGFETPATSGYLYGPMGTPWAFIGNAGITANGTGFTAGNPPAPQGLQVAFLQTDGSFSQRLGGVVAGGTYTLRFQAAQRGNWQASSQDFRVLVDDREVGVFRPDGIAYHELATATFTAIADTVLVRFVGIDSDGSDNTAFIDDVRLEPVAVSNLIGHWRFDDGSGAVATDSSGNRRDGVVSGGAWTDGMIGGVLTVEAEGRTCTDGVPPLDEQPFTVAFWLRPDGRPDGSWRSVIHRGDDSVWFCGKRSSN